jgi:ankyrin repeat protein
MIALHLTTYFGIKEATSQVLETQSCWDEKDSNGRTLLSWAAGNGHQGIVELLLKKGASIRLKDIYSQTPLSRAAGEGHGNIIKLLLKRPGKFLWAFLIIHKILRYMTKLILSIMGLSLPF